MIQLWSSEFYRRRYPNGPIAPRRTKRTRPARATGGRSLQIAGLPYTFKFEMVDRETGAAVVLVEALVPPGGGPSPIVHHWDDQAFYVVDGRVEFRAGSRTETADAGATYFVPRGTEHRFTNIGETPSRLLALFAPGRFEELCADVGASTGGPVVPRRLEGGRLCS